MKNIKNFVLFFLFLTGFVAVAEANMNRVIDLYGQGRYSEAARILKERELKNDKIYYYLGLIYYRSGERELAKKAFLSSWYINPESKWGKASYKNWRRLSSSETAYEIRAGINYDSNVMYAPDYFPGTVDAVLGLGATLKDNQGGIDFELIYDRKQNVFDSSAFDYLNAKLRTTWGICEVVTGAGISLFAFDPFYNEFSGGIEVGPISVEVSKTAYFEKDFNHLSNEALRAGLNKNFGKINAGYFYKVVNARDKESLSYYEAYGSVEDEKYDFEEKVIDENVFETFSYNSHGLSLLALFTVGEGRKIRAGISAQRRFYVGKDKGYFSHWVNDSGQWYYWDDEEGNWVASNEEAPGERQVSSREDTYLRGSISLLTKINTDTETEVFYRYENNISLRDTEPFFSDRQWQKHSAGLRLRYNF